MRIQLLGQGSSCGRIRTPLPPVSRLRTLDPFPSSSSFTFWRLRPREYLSNLLRFSTLLSYLHSFTFLSSISFRIRSPPVNRSMASRYEVEVTVNSARDLKNVNWRYGDLRPYAVVWIDPAAKCSTKVDVEGDVNPVWNEKLRIPLPSDRRIEDSTLCIDIVHAKSNDQDETKPLVGSARLHLHEVVDDAGFGGKCTRSLKLKRPSGRPQGKLEVKVAIKEPARYYDPYAPPYGQPTAGSRDYPAPPPPYGPPAAGSRDYPAPPPYGQPQYGYVQPYAAAPHAGYPYSSAPPAYGGPPAYGQGSYAGGGYGAAAPSQDKTKSKFGMGTGLAVGAAAGVLGGLALAEGIDYVEDKIEDKVAERVEDDLAYEDGGYDDF